MCGDVILGVLNKDFVEKFRIIINTIFCVMLVRLDEETIKDQDGVIKHWSSSMPHIRMDEITR